MVCPICGGEVKHRDYVRRMVRSGGPGREWVEIERMICCKCGHVGRYLPDWLYPFKHYRKDIIDGFVAGRLTSTNLIFEDYPCEMTILRWTRSHKLQGVV